MTSIIKILPPQLANKIAAGEVVGRPASVVKELAENAIDARAKSLTVIIKDGGKTLIHVIDDGNGMSREDAALAFERHATSKIATYEDLENIRTLGFRGEALASIAAVAQVELRTRQASTDVGARVIVDGGMEPTVSPDAFPVGTSVMVKNLFYNTPGRRNFLKNNSTEFKHIFDIVQRTALAYPSLAIRFISDDETVLNLQAATLVERVKDIFGEKASQTVFYFKQESDLAIISGLLGKPDFARKSRVEQYLFLNNRYIINRSINHAVFQAYENMLEKGSFPFFIVFLEVDPHRVDVNVHPSKMEVKFDDESSMYKFVLSSVRRSLSEHDLVPKAGIREESSMEGNLGLRFQHTGSSEERAASWRDLLKRDGASAGTTELYGARSVDGEMKTSSQAAANPQASTGSAAVIWQVHNKYLLVPIDEGLMVVDQHAAHERVIYELAMKRFAGTHAKSQQLLFPQTIDMTPGDAALVKGLQSLLEALGFSLKFFGKTTVIIDGVPVDVKPGQESAILQNTLDLYKEDEHNLKLEPREKLAKSFSCKAAIKAGDPLNQPEMHSLLDQLFGTEIPFVCPHGRPVIVKLSLAELDRRFGRTS
ncbi:MAG TPA: DNA mismatch repair endonuclease MutL [Bacteroidota bacterium]|nr:DNA mismatch repair endonuclease MutL [Bacteroidota bacterium]